MLCCVTICALVSFWSLLCNDLCRKYIDWFHVFSLFLSYIIIIFSNFVFIFLLGLVFPLFQFQAANYLNVMGLLDLTCQTVADMIKGKTPEQIRAIFNIVNDFTPEEEEEIRRENAWAFE